MKTRNLENFNLKETKRNVSNYFMDLERLQWEHARLNLQKGLTAKCDVANENEKQAYFVTGQDEFNLSAKEGKEEEIKKYLAGYYWAESILSQEEQLYITEYFAKGKYEDEVIALLGFSSSDSRAFRNLKRKAIYKFAYVLNLIV